jgi:pilus assembly protein CpaE
MTAVDKISVLIVDDIPETRENLRKLLYFEPDIEIAGTAANGREAIEQAKALQPNIVLMDINMPDMDGIAASQEISQAAPMCQVIMMSVQSEADYLRRSMLAGAMDFLTKPFSSEELSGSIHRVYEMGASRRAAIPAAPAVVEETPVGPKLPAGAGRGPSRGGKILLFYSPKGGTGCSTVAANLAIALHQVTSKQVALVDGSLQFGDLDVLFNLQGNRSIADATTGDDGVETELLSAVMAPHPSGIRVLSAPASPEMSEAVSPENVKEILNYLRQDYAYILVDSASHLDDTVLAMMDLAHRVLIVMTPEIPSIKSTKQFFEVAEALQYPLDQIDLILNKVIPRDDIRAEQIESSMKHSVMAQLSYEPKSVRLATNQGLPLIMAEPKHPLSQDFVALAEQERAALEPKAEAAAVTEEDASESVSEHRRRAGLLGRLKR